MSVVREVIENCVFNAWFYIGSGALSFLWLHLHMRATRTMRNISDIVLTQVPDREIHTQIPPAVTVYKLVAERIFKGANILDKKVLQ